MKITQVQEFVNTATKTILGEELQLNQDLTNIVDIGNELKNLNAVDNYVRNLTDVIGKTIFVNRVYKSSAPSLQMDAWQYGSILQKISTDKFMEAEENPEWNLQNGETYDQYVVHTPTVSAKYFNDRVSFQIPLTITYKQVEESFHSAEKLNAFISMVFNDTEKSLTIKLDSLIQSTINYEIARTIATDVGPTEEAQKTNSGVRAINLLKLYNDKFGTKLEAKKALTDGEFIRFACMQMNLTADRLKKLTSLFNEGKKSRFTPKDLLHTIVLSEFDASAKAYLYSNQYHDDYVKLGASYETLPYWQSSGLDYSFESCSSIDVTVDLPAGKGKSITEKPSKVKAGGVLAVMFDRDAMAVSNLEKDIRTAYNAKGNYWNYFYNGTAGYLVDTNENAVVFYIA